MAVIFGDTFSGPFHDIILSFESLNEGAVLIEKQTSGLVAFIELSGLNWQTL